MGRSKFPGKPSKHVNKTRVNVLPCSVSNISSLIGEVCTALTFSNKTTNDLEQKTICNESSQEEVENTGTPEENEDKKPSTTKDSLRIKSQSPITRKPVGKRYGMSNAIHSKVKTIKTTKKPNDKYFKLHDKDISQIKTQRIAGPNNAKVNHCLTTRRKIKTAATGDLNSVGKFVLPSRSLHSSRVIKPNKRFISIEQNCNASRVDLRTFEKNRLHAKVEKEVTCDKNKEVVDSNSTRSHNIESDCTRTPNGRVVLRQARLQLHSQSYSQVNNGLRGPFSNYTVAPGTVTCGVCGAVRFYRFVKQARKFNIYSCESCRKFISKMIKRQTCSKSSLVCHKGLGTCHVPPIVRSQQWKLIRCAYRARCPACWLKMCLRSFQMPAALKSSLARLLPDNMQGPDSLFTTSLLTWQQTSPKPETETKKEESSLKTRQNRSSQQSEICSPSPSIDLKRQKINLKGPRVKHVCRSASIVLGQPLATFSSDTDKNSSPLEFSDENCVSCDKNIEDEPKISQEVLTEDYESQVAKKLSIKQPSNESQALIPAETVINVQNSNIINSKKAPQIDLQNYISIDYWETYDPDEVCRSGLGLMSSEPFPMLAVCFLCGSAGKEMLLHCSLCCEPYHSFCLSQGELDHEQSYSWVCPRCTTCNSCGKPDRKKINCQKCHKAYHPECFNIKWRTNERPTICSACLQCKSCGSDNITKFVGNLPLCVMCFKLRKKGNFCPICQECYDENDFITKMMECGKCSKWIHAKCEGLTDEQYQILSVLPENVEYLCCLCTNQSTPGWKKALDAELKASYYNVLKLLSKNHTVRKMLKWSPCVERTIGVKPQNVARKLQFFEKDNQEFDVGQKLLHKKSDFKYIKESIENKKDAIELPNTTSDQEKSMYHSLSILEIKNKLNSNEIRSLKEFNMYMEKALGYNQSETLKNIYNSIINEIFPWYDPSKVPEEESNLNNSLLDNTQLDIFDEQENFSEGVEAEDSIYRRKIPMKDTRTCSFCKKLGDGAVVNENRLLFCGQNEWVHSNCALWSAEVYEEIDGSLQNVHSALSRSRSIRCAYCKQKGASVGCCAKGCFETYHFNCARTANCIFMHDKTVFCSTHPINSSSNVVVSPKDFDIRRSVYVELDKKKKRFADPEKVYFMVGSLSVTNLGTIIPLVSDTSEAIIPSGFTCSRLFWSTIEPWKLVSYVIKTSVLTSSVSTVHVDKNFTVDHSLPNQIVNQKLKEILMWQKELDSNIIHSDLNSGQEESDEEPQNTADILPPELTDAILEEIPHDLLDGISMQDIFRYEDLINMDIKANDLSNCIINDAYKEDSVPDETDLKKNNNFNNIDNIKTRELKRSKSEIISEIANDKLSKARNQQRSCSLTWSCKLDSSLSPSIKKRKITPRETSMFVRLLQVDGACDLNFVSKYEAPTRKNLNKPLKYNRHICKKRKKRIDCFPITKLSVEEKKKELRKPNKNCIGKFQTKSMKPIQIINLPQLDGTFDNGSDNECSSLFPSNKFNILQLNGKYESTSGSKCETESIVQDEPVQCNRCQCTYRTKISFKRHLSSCEAMSSESDSECIAEQEGSVATDHSVDSSLNLITEQSTHFTNEPYVVTAYESISTYQTTQNEVHSSFVNTQMVVKSSTEIPMTAIPETQPIVYQSFPFQSETTVPQTAFALPQQIQIQNSTPTVAFTPEPTPLVNISASPLVLNTPNPTNIIPETPITRWVKPTVAAPKTVMVTKNNRNRGRPPRSLAIKRNNSTSGTIVLPQENSTAPTIIMQHLTTPNILPTYVDAFQQQTGQNLQYVATISPTVISGMTATTPQFLQLQSDNSLVGLISGIQPTMIIQQPRIEPQVLLDTSGSIMLTTQPVYYGFETIVQNTVMSSQQFVPTALPGILATNSSYSATTQVFQTSKIEPVLDVSSGSYVLLNSGQIMNSQTIPQPSFHSPAESSIPSSIASTVNSISTPTTSTWKVTAEIPPIISKPNNVSTTNSITLPVAPFVPEQQGIPMNIVTPIPQIPPPQPQVSRPMNRVLPMQTVVSRDINKPVPSPPVSKALPEITPESESAKEIAAIPEPIKPLVEKSPSIKEDLKTTENITENSSLKLIFQKQNQDGVYKISNKLGSNHIQIAPLKPLKTKLQNKKMEAMENKADSQNSKKTIFVVKEPKLNSDKQEIKTPAIMYTVESQDGFQYSSTSINELWSKVFESVQAARKEHNMPPLPESALCMMNDLQLLGLKTNGLRYLLEQLPGASRCTKYKPNFHFSQISEESIEDDYILGHSNGAIRCCPKSPRLEPYDMFSWLASRHRKPEHNIIYGESLSRKAPSVSLPMAMRFRQLKETSKVAVGVYRSNIHRRGLFCLRDIESGEMVIEYAGEVIRSILTDKREKYYNSKGIGCYMFRIDDNLVVDATMKGNSARFINHSCDPNCYSRVLEILGHKHILIFALRRIARGEELTYDYKFPFEEDKIPCTCGAKRCRKFLN